MVDNTRGILAMSAAVVVFIFNDALIKLAAESVPAVQAIGVRGVFATLWCALALLVTGTWRQLRWAAHPRIVFRGLLEAGSAIFYLIALFQIPFAIANAVNLSTPVILTVTPVLSDGLSSPIDRRGGRKSSRHEQQLTSRVPWAPSVRRSAIEPAQFRPHP